MTAKLGARCAYGIVFAAILLAAPSTTRAEGVVLQATSPTPQQPVTVRPQPTQTINLGLGISTTITTPRPYSTINIVDPNIVDAVAQTDRSAILVPKGQGVTSLTIYDGNNEVMAELLVIVDEVGLGRVKIHNQARLGSVSVYRCGVTSRGASTGCELVSEQIMKAPAPVLTNNERREIIIRNQGQAPNVNVNPNY